MKHIQTFENFIQENAGDTVTFALNDDKLDSILQDKFGDKLDYLDVKGDSYYVLPQREFDRFVDLGFSKGFNVDYENDEDSVIILQ